jgi:feruloyl esterase
MPHKHAVPLLLIGVVCASHLRAAAPCESLKQLSLPHTTITTAQAVAAAGLPAFCRVAATLQPTSDSTINIEVWLPASGWNGKLLGNGNGGWSGSIRPTTLGLGLRRGYATAMTDTGHEGSSADFALGHPEKLVDFGYRAVHEMTLAAKTLATAYYGRAPRRSYWNGCSAGGRQGLMEAQRYPTDYDGIIAGAPGLDWTGRAIQAMVVAQAAHRNQASYLPPAKYAVLHEAVLRACDALDGLRDGVLEDPRRCRFDPQETACAGGDGEDCLTAEQVETARRIYTPVRHPRTSRMIVPGYERGSELGWATMAGPQPFRIGLDMFRYVVFRNPAWDYRDFRFDRDVGRALEFAATLNAQDPNLRPFLQRGGKLIHYHGWNDPQIAPGFSLNYYQGVLHQMGGLAKVQPFYRLFLVPGMAHCGGGQGAAKFDMIEALERWVEQDQPPNHIPAQRIQDGKIDRTRPLCPYPRLATYTGTGNPDDAANFFCREP